MTKYLKLPELFRKLSPVSVLFATVIAAGFPTNTVLIDALSINIGNSNATPELRVVGHGLIACPQRGHCISAQTRDCKRPGNCLLYLFCIAQT